MRRTLAVATVVLTASLSSLFVAPATAHATGCDSAANVTADLWEEWGKEAMMVGCAVTSAASGGVSYAACYKTAKTVENITKNVIKFWNNMAKNSWAKIGPRQLTWKKSLTGNVIGTTGRLFVGLTPSPADGKVTIKITKTGGKGKAGIALCKSVNGGKPIKVEEWEFPNGDDNIGKSRTFSKTLSKDAIWTLHIDGKSATREFGYKVWATYDVPKTETKTVTDNRDDVDRTVKDDRSGRRTRTVKARRTR